MKSKDHNPVKVTSAETQVEDTQDPYVLRILDAARELFLASGLEDVSMYAIAKRAGIGQGSLYRRFSDKGEICSMLLQDSKEKFIRSLEKDLMQPVDAPGILVQLRSCIDQSVDFIEQHAELLKMITSEFTGKRQLTQFEHPFFQRINKCLTDLIERAVASGELKDVDPQLTATALIAVLSPDLYLYQKKHHGTTKEQIKEHIITLFVTGLKANCAS